MAKKQTVNADLFAKTDEPQAKQQDPLKARGVGLKESEWLEIESIANSTGKTTHAISAYLLRFGLKAWREGKIKTETKKTIDLPDL